MVHKGRTHPDSCGVGDYTQEARQRSLLGDGTVPRSPPRQYLLYFRRRIPTDLLDHYDGKREIKRSPMKNSLK